MSRSDLREGIEAALPLIEKRNATISRMSQLIASLQGEVRELREIEAATAVPDASRCPECGNHTEYTSRCTNAWHFVDAPPAAVPLSQQVRENDRITDGVRTATVSGHYQNGAGTYGVQLRQAPGWLTHAELDSGVWSLVGERPVGSDAAAPLDAILEAFPGAWKDQPARWIEHVLTCDACGKHQIPRILNALAAAFPPHESDDTA